MSDYQGNIVIKNPATPTGPSAYGSAPGMWKLNEVAYWIKQGVWPDTNIVPDQYFPYVSLLLSTTSLSNANNNLFADSSGAFNPISRTGNTTQGSATPYGANWSNYFDGASTLTFSQINMAGDFTIESWVYYTGTGGGTVLGALPPNHQSLRRLSGKHYFYRQGVDITGTIDLPVNQWVHLAATRSSGEVRIFTNGVLDGSRTITGTFSLFCLGGINTTTDRLTGYVSNVRVVNGTALYTDTFSPPTAPLTAVSGTALLTSQSNRFIDNSTNNLTLTRNGNVTVTEFSPFAPAYPGISYDQSDITNWSGYFDGSTNYLSVNAQTALSFGTGDFTVEAWVYPTSVPSIYAAVVEARNTATFPTAVPWSYGLRTSGSVLKPDFYTGTIYTGATTVPLNSWTHLAFTRSGTTLRAFVNGALDTAWTGVSASVDASATAQWIGRLIDGSGTYFPGYISNLRVVKGTAVYTSAFTPPTSSLTAISGTSLLTLQNAAFTDNSTNNFVVTINGNTTVTGNSPFNTVGYWSLYGPSTAGATIPQTTATDLGSGSFTVECWVNLQNYTTDGIVTKRRTDTLLTGSWGIFVTTSGFIRFQGVGWASTYTATTNAIPLNIWTHIAVSRSGTNLSVYVNGVRVINVTDSYDYTCSAYTIIKLGGNSGGNYPSGTALRFGFDGAISNVRIVQGAAVYDPTSTSFTVPTSPLTAVSGTSLLTCQNGTMKDNSANNNTSISLYNSAAAIKSFNPFYTSTIASNGGSMYFDGTGDYLAPANGQQLFTLGATFTLDFWVYLPAAPAVYATIVETRTVANLSSWLLGIWNTGGALRLDAVYAGSRMTAASTVIPVGAWTHVTFSQVSGVTRFFVNGVADSTTASSVSWNSTSTAPTIGKSVDNYYFSGYMAGFRLVKGSGVSANFTPPTAPVTPTPNTVLLLNGMNAGAYDATAINDMETVGNAQVSTVQSKFGGSSVYFDGSGDWLDLRQNNPVNWLGTGDYTIEFWVYGNSWSTLPVLLEYGRSSTGSTPGLEFYVSTTGGTLDIYGGATTGTLLASYSSLSTTTWTHVALARASGSTRLFINGTQSGSTATDTTNYSQAYIRIGAFVTGANSLNGYLDDFRITKGVARYTTNFTPPTQAFPTY